MGVAPTYFTHNDKDEVGSSVTRKRTWSWAPRNLTTFRSSCGLVLSFDIKTGQPEKIFALLTMPSCLVPIDGAPPNLGPSLVARTALTTKRYVSCRFRRCQGWCESDRAGSCRTRGCSLTTWGAFCFLAAQEITTGP